MNDLSQLLRGIRVEGVPQKPNEKPAPAPEAAIETLREICGVYRSGNPFRPGNLVTPRPYSHIGYSGRPHIVLETRDAEPFFELADDQSDVFSPAFGMKFDIRIAYFDGEQVLTYWVESWQLEAYKPQS
jgi:hypothetical protein